MGACGGLITALHWEHAVVAYRNPLEWAVLGGIALLAALLPLVLARWTGAPLPAAETAWRALRHGARDAAIWLGALRGLLLFAAAVAALLLFVDSRYRDFPTLLYLLPALLLAVPGWLEGRGGRAECLCAVVIAVSVIGRWLPEPANPQAIGWLLTGLGLALPMLRAAPRPDEDEQRQ